MHKGSEKEWSGGVGGMKAWKGGGMCCSLRSLVDEFTSESTIRFMFWSIEMEVEAASEAVGIRWREASSSSSPFVVVDSAGGGEEPLR